MVDFIDLEIPLSVDVDNPIDDAALMARIGAKKICDFPNWFELKNVATGTRFTFMWYKSANVPKSNFVLRKKNDT